MAHPNKIIIAEKNTLIREALCLLISSIEDVEIVGRAKDGEETIKSTQELMPDLVVMSFDMPETRGRVAIGESFKMVFLTGGIWKKENFFQSGLPKTQQNTI